MEKLGALSYRQTKELIGNQYQTISLVVLVCYIGIHLSLVPLGKSLYYTPTRPNPNDGATIMLTNNNSSQGRQHAISYHLDR